MKARHHEVGSACRPDDMGVCGDCGANQDQIALAKTIERTKADDILDYLKERQAQAERHRCPPYDACIFCPRVEELTEIIDDIEGGRIPS